MASAAAPARPASGTVSRAPGASPQEGETIMRLLPPAVAVVAVLALLLPAVAGAQAIGGSVTDSTGGVLPGVTVEARSPALIEQVRSNVTDGSGRYQIVALEPGVYSVTFALPGFRTLVREGVELGTGFTANIDAEMAVGALEETVTVTEATPLIDVQSVEQSARLDRELFETLPTARTYDAMALLIPAINIAGGPTTTMSGDTGGIGGHANNRLAIHGSDQNDALMQIDGMDINHTALEGTTSSSPFDTAIAEYVYDYSGNAAEVETGGVRVNMVPKEGGNRFSGGFYADFAHSSWLANNVDQRLVELGITGGEDGGTRLDRSWYVAPSFGGPIVRDRLWFVATASRRIASLLPVGVYHSEDTSRSYVPDLDRPMVDRQKLYEATLRLTWQATSKDKVNAFWNNNSYSQIPLLSGSTLDPLFIAPEAGSENTSQGNLYQITWVRPQTNRVLFEFGFSRLPISIPVRNLSRARQTRDGTGREDIDARPDLPALLEATTLTMSRNMQWLWNATDVKYSTNNTSLRASMSYVTGTHNLKFGVQTPRSNGRSTG